MYLFIFLLPSTEMYLEAYYPRMFHHLQLLWYIVQLHPKVGVARSVVVTQVIFPCRAVKLRDWRRTPLGDVIQHPLSLGVDSPSLTVCPLGLADCDGSLELVQTDQTSFGHIGIVDYVVS